jgi:hypothetical protein
MNLKTKGNLLVSFCEPEEKKEEPKKPATQAAPKDLKPKPKAAPVVKEESKSK